MIRSVGPLLFGLGLCAASGCASVGAGRGMNTADRIPPNRSSVPKRSSEIAARRSKQIEPTGSVTFRSPTRPSGAAPPSDSNGSLFVGHAPELHDKSTVATSPRQGGDSSVIRAGHQLDSANAVIQADVWTEDSPADGEPKVVDAHYRSDRDGSGNPVQLQGLQVVESTSNERAGQTNPWAEHQTSRPNVASEFSTIRGGPVQPVNAQSPADPSGPWQADLDRLIAKAERELAAMPAGSNEYRRQQVHLRLLYLIARSPEQALTVIPSLDPADQEYWQQMVWAITNSLDAEEQLSPRERAAQSIPPVNTALRRLREQADLTIRNSAFCEKISYFGNYKRFPKDDFVPGQQEVLLYAEIENFRSEPSLAGEYRTLLKSRIEIVGADGELRWWKNFEATEDLCRNPRRDYFHNYQFTIPAHLHLGPHTLKLIVVDELSGKQATSAIKFMVK